MTLHNQTPSKDTLLKIISLSYSLSPAYTNAPRFCYVDLALYKLFSYCVSVVTVVLQAAAVATFGGFARSVYGAEVTASQYTYLGWCFWTGITASVLTLLAAACFIGVDCFGCRRRTRHKSTDH